LAFYTLQHKTTTTRKRLITIIMTITGIGHIFTFANFKTMGMKYRGKIIIIIIILTKTRTSSHQ